MLGGTVGTDLNIAATQGLGQNIPNPFDCETRVELSVSQREDVRMQLLDVAGKVYAEYNGSLDAGVHTFDISAANPQTYLLNAMVGNRQYSIRMVNVGSGCGSSIKYAGISGSITAKLTSANEFQNGDNMRYVGYATIGGLVVASDVKEQAQVVSQYVTLNFTHYSRPTVETLATTDITITSATLHGNIIDDGGTAVTSRGFYYGTDADNLSQILSAGSGNGEYSKTLSGLSVATTYYYCAFATNSAGTAIGEVMSFTSLDIVPPTVQTNAATSISTTGATLNGNVTADGGATVTARGFVYGTSASNLLQNVQSGNGTGSFTANISGLADGTTYYYKAYATNSGGTSYGDVRTFTTIAVYLPTVTTGTASSGTGTGATLSGNVTSDGNATVTARGFVYGTSANNLSQTVQSGSGTGSFTKALTGLSASTTYYYKAYATNTAGTAYGDVMTFTTSATTGTVNGHAWVDLGLPSGTKWATCNVGASTPTAYGNYYAWGETTTKSSYTYENYTYIYNLTTLPSGDDAATANWGSGWRMPTATEMQELIDNCTVTWTTQSGVNGRQFTGPNGNSIFLPAAGYRIDSSLYDAGSIGYYWSSSRYTTGYTGYAWSLYFNQANYDLHYDYREAGFTVRPVYVSSQN